MGELIGFLSGKGGTGKTTVCAAVATALAKSGQRVLCIDCDVGLRNLDISLGLAERSALSFLDICEGRYTLEQVEPHPHYPTLFFLTAPVSRQAEQIPGMAFQRMLRAARTGFDFVFLDAPAGIDAGFRMAAEAADRIILVTGPDRAAIRDASRSASELELMGKQSIRLVVNRINRKTVSTMKLTVDDIMDEAGLPLLGVVPEDPGVILASSQDIPLLEYSRRGAAAACRRIARRLQGISEPIRIR